MNAKINLPPQIPAAKVEQVQNRPRPCDKNLAVAKEKTPTWKKKIFEKNGTYFQYVFRVLLTFDSVKVGYRNLKWKRDTNLVNYREKYPLDIVNKLYI